MREVRTLRRRVTLRLAPGFCRAAYEHRFVAQLIREAHAANWRVDLSFDGDTRELIDVFLNQYLGTAERDGLTLPEETRERRGSADALVFTTVTEMARVARIGRLSNGRAVVLWYQGIVPEESWQRRKSVGRYCTLRLLERWAIGRCARVLVPSRGMAGLVAGRCSVPRRRFLVTPNLLLAVPPPAELLSPDAGSGVVFGYSGSCGPGFEHQCFETLCRIVREAQRVDPRTRLAVATPQVGAAAGLTSDYGVENTLIRSCGPREHAGFIQGMDVGWLIRENSILNRVAHPLKVLDYLGNGVPVLYTRSVRAAFRHWPAAAGREIDSADEREAALAALSFAYEVRAERDAIRRALRDCAEREWTWGAERGVGLRRLWQDLDAGT